MAHKSGKKSYPPMKGHPGKMPKSHAKMSPAEHKKAMKRAGKK